MEDASTGRSSTGADSPRKHSMDALVKQVRQAVQSSEQLLRQATLRDQQCIEQNRRYTVTRQKLQIIFAEIQKQLGVIKRLMLSLRHKNGTLLENIAKTRAAEEQNLSNLQRILEQLQGVHVHPNLVGSGTMHEEGGKPTCNTLLLLAGDGKKTLYDFVNLESVVSLQVQAETEIKEKRTIETQAQVVLQQVDEQFRDITQNSEKLLGNMNEVNHNETPSAIGVGSGGKSVNDMEIKSMGTIVMEITGLHDRIQYVINEPKFSSVADAKEIEKKVAQLPSLSLQLENMLAKVNMNSTFIEERYKKFSEFHNSAIKCYQELEKMAPTIPSKVVLIDELQTSFHQKKVTSTALFEEIRDLSIWYAVFQTAYENLLLEIDRRHKVYKDQGIVIQEIKNKLDTMFTIEDKKRQQFFEEFGRYLPSSLCPSILEPTPKFSIHPPVYHSNLPKLALSQEEIQSLNKSANELLQTAHSTSENKANQ